MILPSTLVMEEVSLPLTHFGSPVPSAAWQENRGKTLALYYMSQKYGVLPVPMPHLFRLHVVRRRRLRHRWELGKLRGMHYERGWVVPHVTCWYKGRESILQSR